MIEVYDQMWQQDGMRNADRAASGCRVIRDGMLRMPTPCLRAGRAVFDGEVTEAGLHPRSSTA